MNGDVCVLCFELLSKPTDRNFIDGNNKVYEELDDLPFVVKHTSLYIRKRCLTVIKKQRWLKNKVTEINKSLEALYRTKCSDAGLAIKIKQVPVHASAKKSKFSQNDSTSFSQSNRFQGNKVIIQSIPMPNTFQPFIKARWSRINIIYSAGMSNNTFSFTD